MLIFHIHLFRWNIDSTDSMNLQARVSLRGALSLCPPGSWGGIVATALPVPQSHLPRCLLRAEPWCSLPIWNGLAMDIRALWFGKTPSALAPGWFLFCHCSSARTPAAGCTWECIHGRVPWGQEVGVFCWEVASACVAFRSRGLAGLEWPGSVTNKPSSGF